MGKQRTLVGREKRGGNDEGSGKGGWVGGRGIERGSRGESIGARRTMATVSMEKGEKGKDFRGTQGGTISPKKKKNLVTLHHRESPIFPNDSVPRSLFNLVRWPRCGDPLRYFSIPRIDLQSFHRLRHFFPPSRSTCIDFVRSESSCIHGSFEKPSVKRHLSPERRSGFEGRTAVPT